MRNQSNSAAKLLDIIKKKDRRITELEQQNEWLLEQFRLLRRKQYGTSSEQIIADQVSIFNEAEASSDLATPEPSLTEVKRREKKSSSSRPKQSLSVMSEMFTPVEIVRTRPTMSPS